MARPRFNESDEEFEARLRRPKRWLPYVVLGILIFCCGVILFPVWRAAQPQPIRYLALSQIKEAGLATLMYANDADDLLPLAPNWMDTVSRYAHDETCLHSPGAALDAAKPEDVYGIGFRRTLSGFDSTKIKEPAQAAVIFDSSNLSRNASGELDLLPSPPRYDRPGGAVNVVAFVDGHVHFTPSAGVVLK